MNTHPIAGLLTAVLLAGPVCAQPDPAPYHIYRGNTHAHTSYTSSHGAQVTHNDPSLNGPPAVHHEQAKAAGYDFYITTDHSQEVAFEPTDPKNANWVDTKNQAASHTDATYVGLAGFEYSENNAGEHPGKGHINIINTEAYLDALEPGIDLPYTYAWLEKTAANTLGGDGPVVATFNHPGDDQYNNWDYRDDAITDIITMLEVINSNDKIHETAFQHALAAGWKVSPVCGNDNHGLWGITNQKSRTCVLATALTKAALLDAMKHRRTYATLEQNLSCSYTCNTKIMGSTLDKPASFEFSITASDPDPGDRITKIEILRGEGTGAVVAAAQTFDSTEVRWKTTIKDASARYFYVRIYNATGGDAASADPQKPVAWLAPIWTGR